MTKQKMNVALIIFTYLIMMIFGTFENLTGPAIPSIVSGFGVSYTAIGTMLLLCTFGYLVGMMVFGFVTDNFGFKVTFLVSCLLVIISAFTLRYAQSFIVLNIMFIVMRIGFGGFETGANSLGALIFLRSSAILMNVMHLFFGVGSIIGSQLIGRFLEASLEWYRAYSVSVYMVLIAIVWAVFLSFPKIIKHEKHEKFNLVKFLRHDKLVWMLMIALGFSELAELGAAGWIVNYLQKSQELSNTDASFYLTMFFVFFSIARLVGGFIAEKMDYLKFIAICALSGSVLFFTAFIIGGWANIFYSLAGAPIAMVFPTILVVLMKQYDQHISSIMGLVMSSAGLFYMIVSQIIGIVADYVSIELSFGIVGLAGVGVFTFCLLAKRMIDTNAKASIA
jgi:fucose permease